MSYSPVEGEHDYYRVDEAALVGDEHTATEAGNEQHHGYAVYFFTRPPPKLLEG